MDDKRDRILDAAERLFVERGYARASTKRIAAEAGVAEGTLYLYFENKGDLLFHVFHRALRVASDFIAADVRPDAPVAENLTVLARRSLAILAERTGMRLLFEREVERLPDSALARLREAFARLEERFAAVFDWGKGRGELRADLDSRLMAHVFMAAVERTGMLYAPRRLFGPVDPAEARRLVERTLEALPSLLLTGFARPPGG